MVEVPHAGGSRWGRTGSESGGDDKIRASELTVGQLCGLQVSLG